MQLSTIPLTSILPYQEAGDTQCGAYCLAYYDWLTGTDELPPFVQTDGKELDSQESQQLKAQIQAQIQTVFDRVRFQQAAIPALPEGYEELTRLLADFPARSASCASCWRGVWTLSSISGTWTRAWWMRFLKDIYSKERPASKAEAETRIHAGALPLDHEGYSISLWSLPHEATGAFIPRHYVLLKREEGVLYVIDPGTGKVQPIFPDPAAEGGEEPEGAVAFEDAAVAGMQYGHAGFVF